jgi:hypothetical protein
MRFTRFVQCCVSIGLLLTPALVYGQTFRLEEPPRVANSRPEAPTTQLPKLSPGAEEVASEIGVRAQVSLVKRDLSKLMLALKSREREEKK